MLLCKHSDSATNEITQLSTIQIDANTLLQTHVSAQVPGALNPYNPTIAQLCASGYTAKIRPPVFYTNKIKVKLMSNLHLVGNINDYQLDHFIPLGLSGHPTALSNLQMQPIKEALIKDKEETLLHEKVCKGKITIEAARLQLLNDWR
jgi:hypothetical protein